MSRNEPGRSRGTMPVHFRLDRSHQNGLRRGVDGREPGLPPPLWDGEQRNHSGQQREARERVETARETSGQVLDLAEASDRGSQVRT